MQDFLIDQVTDDGAVMENVVQRNPFRLNGDLC